VDRFAFELPGFLRRGGASPAGWLAAASIAMCCCPVPGNPLTEHLLPHLPAALVFGPLGPVALAAWLPALVSALLAAAVASRLPDAWRARLARVPGLRAREPFPGPWIAWAAGVLMLSSYMPAGLAFCAGACVACAATRLRHPERSVFAPFAIFALAWLGLVALHLALPLRWGKPLAVIPLWLAVGVGIGTRLGSSGHSPSFRAARELMKVAPAVPALVWGLAVDPVAFSTAWSSLVIASPAASVRLRLLPIFVAAGLVGIASGMGLSRWIWVSRVLFVAALVAMRTRALRRPDDTKGLLRNVSLACLGAAVAATASAILDARAAPSAPLAYPVGAVYDVLVDPAEHRLYYTLKHGLSGPSIGWIDLGSASAPRTRELESMLERMALVPRPRTLVVGGANGLLALDPVSLELEGSLQPDSNVDLAAVGSDVFVVREASSALLRVGVGPTATTSRIPLGPVDLCSRWAAPHLEWGHLLTGACRWPYSVARDPLGETLFVADFASGSQLSRLDIRTGETRTRFLGPWSMGTCVSADGRSLFVARPLLRRIEELDARTLDTRGSFDVGFGARELACLPEEGLVAASDFVFGRVWLVDPARRRRTATFHAAHGIRSLAYEATDRRLFIGASDGVHAIDLAAIQLVPGTRP